MEQSKGPNLSGSTWMSLSSHKEVTSLVTQVAVSSPSLQSPTNERFEEALSGGYRLIIKKGTNRHKLFRFLLSRIRYSKDGFHLDDFLCFFDVYFRMIDEKDPKFQNRVQTLLDENLIEFLNKIRGTSVFPYHPKEETLETLDKLPLVYPSRAYFGLERAGWSNLYRLCLKSQLIPRKILPKAYIGVGYKDKGSRRNRALDGSPNWQEVASHFALKEREAEESLDPPPDSLEAGP